MSEEDFRVHFPENRSFFSFYTLKKALQALFALAMVALLVLMAVRSCTSKGTSEMQEYLWTKEAFEAAKGEDFRVYEIPATNEQTVTSTFAISHIYYTEPLNQIQFLLSFNKSKLEEWSEYYGLEHVAQSGEALFAFTLETQDGKTRYATYRYITDEQLRNGFYRLVFDDVSLSHVVNVGTVPDENNQQQDVTAIVPVESLILRVWYAGDVDFDGEKIDEFTVWSYGVYRQKITPSLPDAPRTDLKNGQTIASSIDETDEIEETQE